MLFIYDCFVSIPPYLHISTTVTMTNSSRLPECLGAVFDCNGTLPNCQNSVGFDFPTLWIITSRYASQCPNGPLLFAGSVDASGPTNIHIALTNAACEAMAGSTWKKYPGADIWARLTTWKFPLFQLVANSPRPPLGFVVEAFTVTHFLGDPIGTISDVLRKIEGTQTRAVFWKGRLKRELIVLGNEPTTSEQRRLWKSLALIVDSFDEWGPEVGDSAQQYLTDEM
ncbi:hypothetical protein R6Q59_009969 [Mikania micrantha]